MERVRRRRRRAVRLLVVLSSAVAVVFLLSSMVLFVWPTTDRPRPAGAVLSLDGPEEAARTRLAVTMVRRGYAPVLLFSQGAYRSTPCPRLANIRVVCFEPDPARTVGEVQWAARYARAHAIGSIIVVSGRPQATRARLLMERCFTGHTIVVPSSVRLRRLPSEVLYEWGALFKALVIDRGC